MASMATGRDVKFYLNRQKLESPNPEIAQHWATLEQLYTRRLWHQLTGFLRDFVSNELFQQGGLLPVVKFNEWKAQTIAKLLVEEEGLGVTRQGALSFLKRYRETRTIGRQPGNGRLSVISEEVKEIVEAQMQLYQQFIADFEMKLNPLSLVEIVLVITTQIVEPTAAISFLESIHEKVKNDCQAKILCKTAVGRVKLNCGMMEDVGLLLEETGEVLDSLDGVTSVHAPFYELSSLYHQIKADHAAYYRDALRFLGCMDINDIPLAEQVDRAFSLSLAALLGENVYNFGELLAHPVLDSLKETEKKWLVDVLFAFNAGDIARFECLQPFWGKQPDLNACQDKLMKKIHILALMELVFKRPAHDRTITFATVSEVTHTPLDQVEHLTMKALSTGLVKGTIDQVSKEITLPWVQPRVLDLTQVGGLQSRMESWCKVIQSTIHLVKDEVPDVVVL